MECTCKVINSADYLWKEGKQYFYDNHFKEVNADCPLHGLIQRNETVKIGEKYHIHFDRSASANKTDGFKVEVNSDNLEEAKRDALALYEWAIEKLKPFPAPAATTKQEK